MAINYPSSLPKGISAGALRQIKKDGYTLSGPTGGMYSKEYLNAFVASQFAYTRKREPLGIYMTKLEEARKDIELTADAVSASAKRMVSESASASSSLTDSSRKMREAADKLTAQMQKFHSTFASTKFDEQAKAATALADALERLAALEEKGLLSKVISALNK